MDPKFSISKPGEQEYLLQFCKDMREEEARFVVPDSTNCWFEDFKQHLDMIDTKFPIMD
jgi:hypothetical protein